LDADLACTADPEPETPGAVPSDGAARAQTAVSATTAAAALTVAIRRRVIEYEVHIPQGTVETPAHAPEEPGQGDSGRCAGVLGHQAGWQPFSASGVGGASGVVRSASKRCCPLESTLERLSPLGCAPDRIHAA